MNRLSQKDVLKTFIGCNLKAKNNKIKVFIKGQALGKMTYPEDDFKKKRLKVQFKKFCLSVKTSCLLVEHII